MSPLYTYPAGIGDRSLEEGVLVPVPPAQPIRNLEFRFGSLYEESLLMKRFYALATASAATVASLALGAGSANAVVFPAESLPFTIRPASNPNLCLEVENRTYGQGYIKALVARACATNSPAQQFSFDAKTKYLHNASRPGECVTSYPTSYLHQFLMLECGSAPKPFAKKFRQTPGNAHIQAFVALPDGKERRECVTVDGEGGMAYSQNCKTDLSVNDFSIVPVPAPRS
jgi:hypothetical protein